MAFNNNVIRSDDPQALEKLQRQLNSNAIYAASRIDFVQPEDGKSPTQLQPKMPQTQKKDEPVR